MSPLHVHNLHGCAPTPLAHYLKALAVLRLVAEQADPQARGCWRDQGFVLVTTLDRPGLLAFFAETYAPTPMITPWNGGSGFFPKDSTERIEPIAHSVAERFAAYRAAITDARALTHNLSAAPKKEEKDALLQRCRERWRGTLAEWLEAALVLGADGSPSYPALLGTGGNDGRLNFTDNFMQRLGDLFDVGAAGAPPRKGTTELLESALFGTPIAGLRSGAIGQFHPGGAGGANLSAGFSGDALHNPWDFVLMLEGAIVLRASLVRRADSQDLPQAAAPFALRSAAVGYGSAATADEGARGEQWMPLWGQPATYRELRGLFAEGRSKLGSRTAGRPLEFARAIARLGVARGITAFERYGYIERNGQANLAVPLGRWEVEAQPNQDLLDEVADWVDRLRAAGRVDHAPASLREHARTSEEAMLACCRRSSPTLWRRLLLNLVEAERALLRSPKFTKERGLRPLPRLGPGWLSALGGLASATPEGTELRLALALASLHGAAPETPDSTRLWPDHGDPIRRHWLPLDLDPKRKSAYARPQFLSGSDALLSPPEVVGGADLHRDALAILRRRAHSRSGTTLGLVPTIPEVAVGLGDLTAFLRGEVDDRRLLTLARGLMALDWRRLPRNGLGQPPRAARGRPAEVGALYALLRLALPFAPVPAVRLTIYNPLKEQWEHEERPGFTVAVDPALLGTLQAANLGAAARIAGDRLRIAGFRPRINVHAVTAPPELARRLAAALLFPVAPRDLHRLILWVTKSTPDPEEAESDASTTDKTGG